MVKRIYTDLVDVMREEFFYSYRNLSPVASYEDEIDCSHWKDMLCFTDEEDQEAFYRLVKEIIVQYYGVDSDVPFYTVTVKQCPVCGHWEDENDFEFDEERNVYVCNQWDYCRM